MTESLRKEVVYVCSSPTCKDTLSLVSYTGHAFGLGGDHFWSALAQAAIYLGWRKDITAQTTHCPFHAAELHLVCARCLARDCFCMGGPRFEARPGDPEDE